jgi:NADH dehydrogenase [ubiquinone] 1 alpha subcomplex assembly factor 1
MKIFIVIFLLSSIMNAQIIYDFNIKSNSFDWNIVDDVVMGGRSNGNFEINKEGHGVFSGYVTTENNGGFSSVRYIFDKISTPKDCKIILTVKGDGKDYQLSIKDKLRSYYSYIIKFKTNGDWQKIKINLKDLYPSFRGQTLDLHNYESTSIEEIAILIGNKKKENFELLLDKIEIE